MAAGIDPAGEDGVTARPGRPAVDQGRMALADRPGLGRRRRCQDHVDVLEHRRREGAEVEQGLDQGGVVHGRQARAVQRLLDEVRRLRAAIAEGPARGVVTLSATGAGADGGGWPLIVAAAGAAAGAAGVESAPVVSLASMPDVAPVVPLLPVLEELQIEGAEVLPEIDQSLEQIDLTMGSIDSAGASLKPTPEKIAAIDTTMTEAGKAVNLAHQTFQARMGDHSHFGRALLETVAEVARAHPNLQNATARCG